MRFAAFSRNAGFLTLVVALVALTRPSTARADGATTVETLLARFQSLSGLEATYRDEQHISLLAAPLVSEGTIHFARPGRLARHTTSPARSSVIVDGRRVLFGDAKKSESLDLDGNPVVRLFVETFVRLLSGDRAWLEKSYRVTLEARDADAWTLRLEPTGAPMNAIVTRLELSGRGIVFDRMTLFESSGDDTVTTFRNVNVSRSYSPEEAARVFTLPSAGK